MIDHSILDNWRRTDLLAQNMTISANSIVFGPYR